MKRLPKSSSWEEVGNWYDSLVGAQGHLHHQEILPRLLKLLGKPAALLDLGCGQGVLARHLPKGSRYVGIDLSPKLIELAQKRDPSKDHLFLVADACAPLPLPKESFSHALFLLSLQNMPHPADAIREAAQALSSRGEMLIVLNHPAFRIPRQSGWGIDPENKLQYRRVNRYLTPLEIPIQMHPSKGEQSESTWSYHAPLSSYIQWIAQAHCVVTQCEEWTSSKKSTGAHAARENRARAEFPLFLTLIARKETK